MKAKLFFVVAGIYYHTRSQAETVAEKLGLSVVTAAECPFCGELNMDWDSQEFCSHPAQYHSQCWKECTIHGSHIMVDVFGVDWKYVRKDYFPADVFNDLLSTGQTECKNYLCLVDNNYYKW